MLNIVNIPTNQNFSFCIDLLRNLQYTKYKTSLMKNSVSLFLICLVLVLNAAAQDNYEIQIYGAQTQARGSTMFELHSNYTFKGETAVKDGVLPSNHALHETLEITTGITDNFEIGAYLFTNYTPGNGYKIVGSHIRPRIMAPAKWHLPVGLSLSMEVGYQQSQFSSETWNIELRPIIDKQWEKLYIAFNPAFGISLKSKYDDATPVFEPGIKADYAFFKNSALGVEYYGSMGPVNGFPALGEQEHAVYFSYDMLNNPKWEFNAAAGFGVTHVTDPFVFKVIVGRKVKWKNKA